MSGMQWRSGFGFSVAAALALCTGVVIGAAQASSSTNTSRAPIHKDGGKNPKQQMKVEGILTAVAPDGSSVSIQNRNGTVVVVPVNAQTKVERDDVEIALSALVLGDLTEAVISTATGVATKIEQGD